MTRRFSLPSAFNLTLELFLLSIDQDGYSSSLLLLCRPLLALVTTTAPAEIPSLCWRCLYLFDFPWRFSADSLTYVCRFTLRFLTLTSMTTRPNLLPSTTSRRPPGSANSEDYNITTYRHYSSLTDIGTWVRCALRQPNDTLLAIAFWTLSRLSSAYIPTPIIYSWQNHLRQQSHLPHDMTCVVYLGDASRHFWSSPQTSKSLR